MSDETLPPAGRRPVTPARPIRLGGPLGGASGHFQARREQTVGLLRTPLRRAVAAALVVVALLLPSVLSVEAQRIAVAVGVAMIGAVGLHVVVGRAGQISLAASAFLAVGAFSAAISADMLSFGFFPSIAVATALGALLGCVLALPAMRLRGLYLILATLGFYWVVWWAVSEYEASRGLEALTGLILEPPSILGVDFGSASSWYYLLLGVNLVVLALVANLQRSKYDRAWVALRDREVMARAIGVSPLAYKAAAFAISSAIISLAGALGAYTLGTISSGFYSLDLGIEYLAMIVIGGLGSLLGAYLGAAFVILTPYLITEAFQLLEASPQVQGQYLPPVQTAIFGLLMAGFLIFEPRGIVGIWERIRLYFQMWPLRHAESEVRE